MAMNALGKLISGCRLVHCIAIIVGLLLSAESIAATNQPAKGMFLVATHELKDSNFSETVILLIQADEQATVGLIINRPTEIAPSKVMPELRGLQEFSGPLYLGGPVSVYGILLLVRSDEMPADAEHIIGNIYASGSRQLLQQQVSGENAAQHLRLYAGHAGWSPGQLDREIARGSWRVIPADENIVFSDDLEDIWQQLAPPAGTIIVRYENFSRAL